jgi:hypothetical protein
MSEQTRSPGLNAALTRQKLWGSSAMRLPNSSVSHSKRRTYLSTVGGLDSHLEFTTDWNLKRRTMRDLLSRDE